ncbi:MAG: DNA recombination protein RmuC [Candidatus Omnitrophica bacterium]|nr:DNA recombination protein RmuC [Candidatus Omnitrophota bacterium]
MNILIIVLAVLLVIVLVFLVIQNVRISELLRSTRDQLQAKEVKAAEDEGGRRAAFEGAIKSLEDKLKTYDDLLREWEKDRAHKFGQLEKELSMSSQATLRLSDTTSKLTNILGNVKLRGQWGERMAEDIIRYAGLLEDVNYRKQTALASSGSRPDFIFLLPDKRVVNMDVKFPLDNYLRMVNATNPMEQGNFEKEFFKNVRSRIKEIRGREYINPIENTLDFVLLFIPNDQVFGFIQEKDPAIMDEALKEKVVLCSPFTLYAVLSVIRQAHENVRFEKDVQKILGHIDLFIKHFETMKGRFLEVGVLIQKLDQKYAELAETSFKNLDTKVRHIEEYKKGHGFVSSDDSMEGA